MKPSELFEVHIAERLQHRPRQSEELCKFHITGKGGGTWVIDRRDERPIVRRGNDDAHCVITLSSEDLLAIADGHLDPRVLFLAGRLKIAGYLHLAIQMAKMLSGSG